MMKKNLSKHRIYSYKQGSASAKALSEALKIPLIKHEGSKYVPNVRDSLINWGCSNLPLHLCRVHTLLNKPEIVGIVANKLLFFQHCLGKDIRLPDWTENKAIAEKWIKDGDVVFARKDLTGHSGRGIVVVEKVEDMVDAPLYTKYVKKKDEYRVHIMRGQIIFTQRKAKRKDYEGEPNWRIRSHDNGFKFIHGRDLGKVHEDVTIQSLKAIEQSGLDFGAVDVIWNDKDKQAYVLEINTAPGLEGTTIQKYAEAFRKIL